MYEEIWRHLIKGKFKKSKAVLSGYKRLNILNETYPGITKQEGSNVNGILVEDLNSNHIKLLDDFEGDLYKRDTVSVLANQNTVKCDVYVIKEKYKHLLSESPWCEETFRKKHLKHFLHNDTF